MHIQWWEYILLLFKALHIIYNICSYAFPKIPIANQSIKTSFRTRGTMKFLF